MASKKKPNGYWTKERCREAALRYQTRTELFNGTKTAYQIAHRNGWLNEVCAHMPARKPRPMFRWSMEQASAAAAKFASVSEFRRSHPGLYTMACARDWIDGLTAHMDRSKYENGYWTKQRCADEAKRYETRGDFVRGCSAAADAAYTKSWMDDVCSHMRARGNRTRRAVYVIKALGLRWVYVGLSYDPTKRYRGHKNRPTRDVAELLAVPHRFRVVSHHLPAYEAARLEKRFVRHFQERGWVVANVMEGGQIGSGQRRWTVERLRAVASQVDTRGELMKKFSDAYHSAHAYRLMDEIFKDHQNKGFEIRRRA